MTCECLEQWTDWGTACQAAAHFLKTLEQHQT